LETQELKQVIVLRRDLEMGKGKMVAQGCHAAVEAVLETMKRDEKVGREMARAGTEKDSVAGR